MTTNAAPSTRIAYSLPILDQASVREVLSRLYAEAEVNDAQVFVEEQAIAAAAGGVIDDQSLASIG